MATRSTKITCMLVLLLLSFIITSFDVQLGSCQYSTIVQVEPSTTSPTIGQAFTVTVSISNVQNLYAIGIVLNWDASILQATNIDARLGIESYSDGVLHETSNSPPIFIAENNLTQSQGEYMLTATSMAPAPSFSGNGNIVRITFNPISPGSSALSLLKSDLYDYPPEDRDPRESLPIDHTKQDSSVTVTAGATPTKPSNPSNTPASSASATPKTSPTATSPTLTPMQTSKFQQKDNLGLEFFLPLSLIIVLMIVILAYIVLRRKKM